MIPVNKQLDLIIDLGQELSRVEDVDLLLEKVLSEARNLVKADAGSIYIKEEDKLRFKYTQNNTIQNKLEPGKKLIYSTFSVPVDHRSIAGYVASTGEMLNIDDVQELSSLFPFRFNKEYDDISKYRTKSVLSFPIKTHRGDILGVLQLINALNVKEEPIPFAKEGEPLLMHFASIAGVALERAQLTRALILRMIKMAELRDPNETGPHVNRVGAYSVEIYEAWAIKKGEFSTEIIERNKNILRMAGMLHDVGKVAISDKILKKPSKLDQEEYETMKEHTLIGAKLLCDPYSALDEASFTVAINHHEKWDGSGYPGHINPFTGRTLPGYEGKGGKPRGKKENEIPPFARAVAVADVYDALRFPRAYKEAWEESRVFKVMKEESGKHFDPDMVEALFSKVDVIRNIGDRYPNE